MKRFLLTACFILTVAINGIDVNCQTPSVVLSSSSMNFGNVNNSGSSRDSVQVTNSGNATLNVSSASITGTNASEFLILSGGSSGVIAAGGSRRVVVQFSPASQGSKTASLVITSDAPSSPDTVALSGTGVNPQSPVLVLSPFALSFGYVNNGSSVKDTVLFTNSGGGALNVSLISIAGTNASEFSIVNGGGPWGCIIQFSPVNAGSKTAWLVITSNASSSPDTVTLNGIGLTPSDTSYTEFPIDIGTYQKLGMYAASDGNNCLAVMQGGPSAPNSICGQLVSGSGALIGSRITVGRTGGMPRVIFDGTNYLMYWSDDANDPHEDIYGQIVSPLGNLVGSVFPITTAGNYQEPGMAACDGTNCLVTWMDDRTASVSKSGPWYVYGQLVSKTGGLAGSEIKISADTVSTGSGAWFPIVTFDGTNYLAVWKSGTQVLAQFIGKTGSLVRSNFLIDTSDDLPVTIYDGSRYVVNIAKKISGAWSENYVRFVDGGGNVSATTKSIATGSFVGGFQDGYYGAIRYSGSMQDGTSAIQGGDYDQDFNPVSNWITLFAPTGLKVPLGTFPIWAGTQYFAVTTKVKYDFSEGYSGDIYGVFAPLPTNPVIPTVQTQVQTAHAGSNLPVIVSVSQPFSPTEKKLYYRKSGQSSYQSTSLSPASGDYTASIPADYVTPRGLEYYVSLSDGQTVVTYPTSDPASQPAAVQVRVDWFPASLTFEKSIYKMVSVPMNLDHASVDSVLTDDYGAYDKRLWRVCAYQENDSSCFTEYPDYRMTFTPGAALWLVTRSGEPFDAENGWSVPSAQPYEIELRPGWNQIGNPFAFSVDWGNVTKPGGVEEPAFYNGTDYDYHVTTLKPWEGYFVKNNNPTAATIAVQPIESSTAAEKKALADGDYVLQLSAEAPGFRLADKHNEIGILAAAAAGRDALDISKAPPIGDYLELAIIEDNKRYAGNFKPPIGDGWSWSLEIRSNVNLEKSIRVSLTEMGQTPFGFKLFVLDKDHSCVLPVSGNSFSVDLGNVFPVRHLQFILGTSRFAGEASGGAALAPVEFALLQNHPNPFNPQTQIPYRLGRRTRVRLDVFDVLGRRVRTLVNETQETGEHAVSWDGRDDSGYTTTAGIYLCRIRTDEFTATRKLIFVR